MPDKELQQIADNDRFIVNGYAFTEREDGFVSVLNLEHPECAMVVSKSREINIIQRFIRENYLDMYKTWKSFGGGDFFGK